MDDPVARNPVPSLLRSLMTDHLDPGYSAAAARRTSVDSGQSRRGETTNAAILLVGAVLVGCVFGIAWAQSSGSVHEETRRDVLSGVRDAESRAASLESIRESLAIGVQDARAAALSSESGGAAIVETLEQLELAAGTESVSGPGIVVTVSEPPPPSNLSDVSKQSRGSSDAAVLDRDLQVVVNSLWVSGAEAVSVDGVRIGPGVTIRQAGGAILVDNRPVFSPYTIEAVGSPTQLQTRFAISDAYLRMSGLAQLYRIGFDVVPDEGIEVAGSSVRAVTSARPEAGR